MTIQPVYTAWSSISSVTALDSLAGAGFWGSDEVDNTTDLFVEAFLGGMIDSGASHVDGDVVNFYVIGMYDEATSTDWGSGIGTALDMASGVDGDTVLTEGTEFLLEQARPLERIVFEAANQNHHFGPWPISPIFGGTLPLRYAVIIENVDASAALGTGNSIGVFGVNYNDV